ncbi:ATPase AAA-type core domain-containing protein [[Candida] zeylanoides]
MEDPDPACGRVDSAPHPLMALLSGSQRKRARAAAASAEAPPAPPPDDAERLAELERKMYAQRDFKAVSASDFLRRPQVVEVVSDEDSEPEAPCAAPRAMPRAPAVTAMSILRRKRHAWVTLRVPRTALEAVQRADNPFFTRGGAGAASGASAFASMMAHSVAAPRMTPLQKLKVLHPPPMAREQWHVRPGDDDSYGAEVLAAAATDAASSLAPRHPLTPHHPSPSALVEWHYPPPLPSAPRRYHYAAVAASPPPASSPAVERALHTPRTRHSLWIDQFKPSQTSHLLLPSDRIHRIRSWIHSAFGRLKAQALAVPRNVQLKKRKRRQDDFIDDDSTEDEVFVPLLIIQGSGGVGKSAAVYAALEEIGGYVYEVNSSQSRSRRDLFSTLKELCTTQLVHRGAESDFQKGIILFDDTDVLFEQDKTFWTVAQEMINISRRPIVITCRDVSNIPRAILEHAREEDTVVNIDGVRRDEAAAYLAACAHSQGYLVDRDIIDSLVGPGEFDLRAALMRLQFLCRPQTGMTAVRLAAPPPTPAPEPSLRSLAAKLDELSHSDVIAANTTTSIKSHLQHNEMLDIYVIDESRLLRQAAQPFELNIGLSLAEQAPAAPPAAPPAPPAVTFNAVRRAVTAFVASRSRKLPKYMLDMPKRATRLSSLEDSSDSEWKPDVVGVPEDSVCRHLAPTPLLLELAPFARNWANFQDSLDRQEVETMKQHSVSVKRFLRWRQFQHATQTLKETI